MTAYLWAAGLVVIGYLCGSIPTGLIVARRRGIDIRERGSGNIGATNVARTLGWRAGAMVLVLDALEGALPVACAYAFGLHQSVDPFVVTATGVAAISGHCFPVWLGFRGGKGVATTLGVITAADPVLAGLTIAVFAAVYSASRIVSLASLIACISMPVLAWTAGRSDAVATLAIAAMLIIIGTHHANIRRLLGGREARLHTPPPEARE